MAESVLNRSILAMFAVALCVVPATTSVADDAVAGLAPPIRGNFAILGFGAGPDYIGSDDDAWAVAPAGQITTDWGRITLIANYMSIDLVDDPGWQLGPAGLLRFGRQDVKDPQIAALPDIDTTLELGVTGGYVWNSDDLRRRGGVSLGVLQDVTGGHGGYVISANLRQWVPVGRFGALGLAAGTTWASDDYMNTYFSIDAQGAAASGLPVFTAGAGQRDARVAAVFVQPISPQVAVGFGVLCARLLDDAARSPVTRDRNQCYGGVGIARIW